MNKEQMNTAQEAMVEWLSHPGELGKKPSKIECAGTFELYDMTYYMFKYKKSIVGKWLLGVCGGYEQDCMENCGHVFSQMEEYDEQTAIEKSKEMIETVREYWMKAAENHKENEGTFVGFTLLSEPKWDKNKFVQDMKSDWDIDVVEDEDDDKNDDTIVFSLEEDMLVAISLMPAPVPENEAEENAKNNYMWPDAVEITKQHKAHLMVAVLGDNCSTIERGKVFVKAISCCCQQKNAIGVYTSGTVFEPKFYTEFASMIKNDELPIFNWIWFGLYKGKEGICCYTYGMDIFGKDNMEVINADASPADVRDFLASLVAYVLEYDVILNDGETIGFDENDKHSITKSDGISLPEKTLKISYENI